MLPASGAIDIECGHKGVGREEWKGGGREGGGERGGKEKGKKCCYNAKGKKKQAGVGSGGESKKEEEPEGSDRSG